MAALQLRKRMRWLRPRFSLRFLIAAASVCGLLAGVLALWEQGNRREHLVATKLCFSSHSSPSLLGKCLPWKALQDYCGRHRFQHLTGIHLRDTDAKPELSILKDLPCLTALSIPGFGGDALLQTLPDLPRLRNLVISGGDITDRGLREITKFPGLEILRLTAMPTDERSRPAVNDHVMAVIGELTKLRSLVVDQECLDNSSLRQLRDVRTLKRLDLLGCDISDEGLKHIATIKGLKELAVSGDKLTGKGIAKLCSLVACERLRIVDADLSGAGLGQLTSCQRLKTLVLDRVTIDDESVRQLAQLKVGKIFLDPVMIHGEICTPWSLPALKELSLLAADERTVMRAMELRGLRELKLRGSAMTGAVCALLGQMLQLDTLEVLDGVADWEALPAILAAPKLKSIWFQGDPDRRKLAEFQSLASVRGIEAHDPNPFE